MVEVIDVSRDKVTGEITQFTIINENGEPDLVRGTPENLLLYDPADVLPFENGLYEFLNGKHALVLSENDPEVMVAPTGNSYAYIVRVDGDTVETTPKQAEAVLQGVLDAIKDEDYSELVSIYDEIRANQVRKNVVNALLETFDEKQRIRISGNGWLVDGFYLVDWSAGLYTKEDDLEDGHSYQRGGGGVVETDKTHEFVKVNINREPNPIEVTINGEAFRLTEREMLFLSKAKWLLNRRQYHQDEPFWRYTDKFAEVDAETGEPDVKEIPDDQIPF